MNFSDWQESVPDAITDDPLWTVEAYRLALFASDACWKDVRKISKQRTMRSLSDQLYRAMGSARESRDWYYKARHVLGENVTDHRLNFLASIIRLLLKMIPQQRGRHTQKPAATYDANGQRPERDALLEDIPLAE